MKSRVCNLTFNSASEAVKTIAKSIYWQSIFINSKEHNIKLFENNSDLTSLQVEFLYYLGYFNNAITDVAAGLVSEKILQDEIYLEAYNKYKRMSFKKEKNKLKSDQIKNKVSEKTTNIDSWVFKAPNKGKK